MLPIADRTGWMERRGGLENALHLLCLLGILALAAVLRFHAVTERGLLYWDEAKFALEGMRMRSAVGLALGQHLDPLLGKGIGTAKPTHALLIALADTVFGVHDYAPLLLNGAASLGEVLLTYLIARRLFCRRVGLIAALLLAASEYDAIYARSALSESDACLLFLAGIFVWLLSWNRDGTVSAAGSRRAWMLLLPAGLLLGVSFTANYRLAVFIGAIVAFDLLWRWYRCGLRSALTHTPPWILGLAIAPLCWELAGAAARTHGVVLFQADLARWRTSYLQEVLYQIHEGKQSAVHFEPFLYLRWYLARQGWPSLIVLLLGLGYAARRRSFAWLVPAALVLLPYLIFIFAPFVVPRNLVPLLPFTCILGAAALVDTASLLRSRSVAASLLIVAVVSLAALGTAMSWRLGWERSGFARAATYTERHDAGRALTTSEIMVFYLRGSGRTCRAPAVPLALPGLSAYVHSGYRYAVLENHHNSDVTAFIRLHGSRRAHYPTLGSAAIGENLISSENTNPPSPDTSQEYVDIFWLGGMPLPPAGGWRASPCRTDQVT